MRLVQTPGEALGLPEVSAEAQLAACGVPPSAFPDYVNFCNSIAANAPLQCVNCPDIGSMAIDAMNGSTDPKVREHEILAAMDNCGGATLRADLIGEGLDGYQCQQTDL